MRGARPAVVASALAALLAAARLPAQQVRGELGHMFSAGVIPGAMVVMLDEENRRVAATITDSVGGFAVRAPAPGRYILRADVVGYQSTWSTELTLAEGKDVQFAIMSPLVPVRLAGVRTTAPARCIARPYESLDGITLLWEEVRKALSNVAFVEEEALLEREVVYLARDLDSASLAPAGEQAAERRAVRGSALASPPADELARTGFVRVTPEGASYFAPGARVLLSRAFLDAHCFWVARRKVDARTEIGLAFQPLAERRGPPPPPDIRGVLWVDERSAHLQRLEFEYTGLPAGPPAGKLRSHIEYARLTNGAWIVRRWAVRVPRLAPDSGARLAFAGIREDAGEIESVALVSVIDSSSTPAVIVGTAYDSIGRAPLAGALVFGQGLLQEARVDSTGAFRLDSVPPGRYVLTLHHPRLDSLGVRSGTFDVTVRPGDSTTVHFRVPSLETLMAAACAGQAQTGLLLRGAVRDAATGVAIPGARVSLAWLDGLQRRQAEVEADAAGYYHVCGLPAGGAVAVQALADKYASAPAQVRMPERGIRLANLSVRQGGVARRGTAGNAGAAGSAGAAGGGGGTVGAAGAAGVPAGASTPPGFEERRRRGGGTFFTRAEIERRAPPVVTELLRGVPGLRVSEDGAEVCAARGGAPGGAADTRSCGCAVAWVLDGRPLADATPAEVNALVAPERLGGVEVYAARRTAPRDLVGDRAECGAVLLWSR